jgi:MFS family permease
VILSDLIPLKQRGTFQGYMNIVFASGMSLGAPVGGIMTDVFGWRWSFGIQIPLIVISTSIVMFRFHLPNRETSTEPMKEKLKRVDFFGAFTLVISPLIVVDVDSLRFKFDTGNEYWWE